MPTRPTDSELGLNPGDNDSRTLLPNRDSFYYDVKPLIEEADTGKFSLVLLVIDLEGVDFILRTFGPVERDMVIREVGQRIRDAAEEETTPYHINQGRFAVLLQNGSFLHATQRAEALAEVLREPFKVAGIFYHLDAFIGISHYPNHADSLGELVRTGVFACYQASTLESRYATYDRAIDEEERYRFRLMLDLEQALDEESGIRLAYQPQVHLQSGECVGVEALCRWEHAAKGPIPPGQFLPFVEQSPLMMPLTEAILGIGLRDLNRWQKQSFEGSMAINLSSALFRRSDMLERLLDHFRYANMPMDQIHFEVTETGIMDQPRRAVNTLSEIRERGSQIAVDDFGTGHSSLAYLADLPIDIIKIDMYFVQNLDKPWGRAIVSAAATLAEQLGLVSIAEGIEDEQQLDQCRDLGVTIGQGFHIGRPMFREQFEGWLGI
ncbi:MAG: bifunctional diguanylate cyclase/phosphodiesterase [Pseudomonadota bacterium]|nr:bifunctional diguanylate cyclase/phosphodiesterase [Pseudomonadota bacterium]